MVERERLICASADLADAGDGVRFTVPRNGTGESAFVIRHRGKVYAYLNRCGHVPVELDWQEGRFFDASGLYLICATHGALYAPENGACLGGRCNGRGLVPLPVTDRDGHIYLTKNN